MTGIGIVAIDIVFALALVAVASCLVYLVSVTWRARSGAQAPAASPAAVASLPQRRAQQSLRPDAVSGRVGVST